MKKKTNVEPGKKGFQPSRSLPVTPSPAPTTPKLPEWSQDGLFTDNATYSSMHTVVSSLVADSDYDKLVQTFEREGMTTSDAQAAADATMILQSRKPAEETTPAPALMNRGARTYDEQGRVCRPSDSYNEWRAILLMQARYDQLASYTYKPSEEMFAPIDGAWYSPEGELMGYSEIKSHAGKTMGPTTILNLRKWKNLVDQNKTKRTILIAQYEDKIAWVSVDELTETLSHLEPSMIHDHQSVQRSTSRELVWRIPTKTMHVISIKDTPLPKKSTDFLAKLTESLPKR